MFGAPPAPPAPDDPVTTGGEQSCSGGDRGADGASFGEPLAPAPDDLVTAGSGQSGSGGDRNTGPGRLLPGGGSARRPVLPPAPATIGDRGRFVRAVPAGDGAPIAALSTVRALATRRAEDASAVAERGDLRSDVRVARRTRLIVVAVDLSGSMGAPRRAAAATDTVLGLLDDAYQRRNRVALVTFRGDGAEVALAPTTSIDVARNRLHDLATGGATPLAAGLRGALGLLDAQGDDHPLLVVLTDGRATGGADALDDALTVAATIRRRGVDSVVVDCEDGPVRLGLAATLATALDAALIPFDDHLTTTITERGQR
ncbi:MAG: VWA domain-containing protein [Ilumatobacteraceae bacterium]